MSREEAKKEATIEVRKARTKKERERGETKRKGKPEKKERTEKGKGTMKIYIKMSYCIRKLRERGRVKDGK